MILNDNSFAKFYIWLDRGLCIVFSAKIKPFFAVSSPDQSDSGQDELID